MKRARRALAHTAGRGEEGNQQVWAGEEDSHQSVSLSVCAGTRRRGEGARGVVEEAGLWEGGRGEGGGGGNGARARERCSAESQ